MERAFICVIAGVLSVAGPLDATAQTLRGSSVAMRRQNTVAQQHDFTFLQTSSQVRSFVSNGYLVKLPGNGHYGLAGVSHPYARPAVRTFVERLASQYVAACGEKLVVTSLTRPVREQPRNASDLSVHPAGMAVDLRVSRKSSCRRWLENTLLSLEKQKVLDVTRETRPPHYHVALFPTAYTKYVAALTGSAAKSVAVSKSAAATSKAVVATAVEDLEVQTYRVTRGESLWSIARRFGTTVDTLKSLNGLKGATIVAGQTITVPASSNGAQ